MRVEVIVAKVYGIHVVELNAGTTPEFFERFVIEQFLPALPLHRTPGVKASLLRADRGARANQYLWMFEFDSVEIRDRYFPQPQRISDELKALIEPLHELAQIWDRASTRTKTDYVVLGSSIE
jgi:hypothetical protein